LGSKTFQSNVENFQAVILFSVLLYYRRKNVERDLLLENTNRRSETSIRNLGNDTGVQKCQMRMLKLEIITLL